ncbi:hypothetical protein N1030_04645 [Desulfovibrio mangrovi]|uniref:SPOR domain-containing protein n=1 Tax=Desulfovibrio mangrovi TaxID=2976983 RepID=UPI0022469BF8|nr:hypothetical protein [Desulfovibrio mangrovi]UZP68273.1 hypothetical protein N1030_04645 [Desulfovibrio mangrovi]
MRRLMSVAIIMALCVTVLAGCKQTAKNVWKDTKKYYREYVNTPATLEFEPADPEPVEDRLATVYTPVGIALESFRRDMENQDQFPTDVWVDKMMSKYPWLSGIAVVATDGTIYLQKPAVSMKALDFAPLFAEDEKSGMRDMRAYAESNPLGPEVYAGTPFFVDNELKGMVIAHFDPRSLLSVCPDPARLVIIAPEGVLWSGHYIYDTTPLSKVDWKNTLESDNSDTESNELGEFFWVSKYLGNMPLVFAATTGEFPIDPSQLNALVRPEPVMDVPTVMPEKQDSGAEVFEAAPAEEVAQEVVAAPILENGMVQPTLSDTPGPAAPTKDVVYSVQVGAFHNPQYAQERMDLVRSHGFTPCLMKLYDHQGQLWHVVEVFDSPDKVAAFKVLRDFAKQAPGVEYTMGILDAGVVTRRKECQ